jgi:hypothetical protein
MQDKAVLCALCDSVVSWLGRTPFFSRHIRFAVDTGRNGFSFRPVRDSIAYVRSDKKNRRSPESLVFPLGLAEAVRLLPTGANLRCGRRAARGSDWLYAAVLPRSS